MASTSSLTCPGTRGRLYYRTFEAPDSAHAHLFEFVVPMVPPSWNDPERVQAHRQRLARSSRPTAVAVSVLDVSHPVDLEGADDDWGLMHLLLDGPPDAAILREP
jgi:hypothetical protein